MLWPLLRLHFCIFFILAGKEDNYKSLDEFNFGHIWFETAEITALEYLEKSTLN